MLNDLSSNMGIYWFLGVQYCIQPLAPYIKPYIPMSPLTINQYLYNIHMAKPYKYIKLKSCVINFNSKTHRLTFFSNFPGLAQENLDG